LRLKLLRFTQDFAAKVFEADKELSGNSADIQAARKVFRMGTDPALNVNERHVYKAVQRILAYRILDVCQWVKGTDPALQSTAVPSLVGLHKDLLNKLVGTNTGSLFPVDCLSIGRKHQKCRTGQPLSCKQINL
jgi:hypothetical protein